MADSRIGVSRYCVVGASREANINPGCGCKSRIGHSLWVVKHSKGCSEGVNRTAAVMNSQT